MKNINMNEIIGIILAGGQGTRLDPLTRHRSKPAVPFGGRYRIIDFPITNCIHSGVGKIFALTQFHSASLNQHITQTYQFDLFHDSFVDIIASEASKDLSNSGFSQGTADAVRKAMHHIQSVRNASLGLILAGDQLYYMDFRKLRDIYCKYNADLTLGVVAVPRSKAGSFGIVKVSSNFQVIDFWEKPKDAQLEADWYIPENIRQEYNLPQDYVFASMSMYLINLHFLDSILHEQHDMMDFGKEIIPYIIKNYQVQIAIHHGYWEDIGTLDNFHKANINLVHSEDGFNIFDPNWKWVCQPSLLPPSKVLNSTINDCIIANGCHIKSAKLEQCIVGSRTIVNEGSLICNSVVMGADWTETPNELQTNHINKIPNIGIGKNCIIKNAIIDKNARIGNNVVLENKEGKNNIFTENYIIRDNIIVIPAKAVIQDGFTL
ncbi:MAG: sugar phosphate nucleotidyltransferase [Brevinemataceae bacterium]